VGATVIDGRPGRRSRRHEGRSPDTCARGVGPITDVWLVRNAVIAAIALHTDLPFSPLLTV
jgi:hypothetical protein